MNRGLSQLRKKLPGFERELGNMIADMAHYENGKRVHGWIEVRHADTNDPLANYAGIDWIAYLHVKVDGQSTYSLPVIPDEHNPRGDKIVRPEDAPHVFQFEWEAQKAAEAELPGLLDYIKSKL